MLTNSDSVPATQACYANKIELAKMLVKNGANSKATTEAVFSYKPATHLASGNESFLALKYLIEECRDNINKCDSFGNDICTSLHVNNKVQTQDADCVACDNFAKSKGVEGDAKKGMQSRIEYLNLQ